MRIRWGRVAGALGAVVAGIPGAVALGGWATMPDPSAVERRHPGPDACSADRVLVDALALHPRHDDGPDADEGGEADRLAAAALLAATRCRASEEVRSEHVFDTFQLARHGVDWIARHEPPATAADQLLDVWELAADQARVGTLVNLGVWVAVQSSVYRHLDEILTDQRGPIGANDRDRARARLVALASEPLDLAEVHVREEHEMWRITGRVLGDPTAWPYFVSAPRLLVHARSGDHPIVAELEADARLARVEAAVLAAGVDLRQRGCTDRPPTLGELADADLQLGWAPRRCVVTGLVGDEVRVATP